jgi:flagellar hook-associated protein 1 FlgK
LSNNLLNIGKSGLFASKKSLETTGHNIANANTEGYSRQRTIQTTATPIIKDGFVSGTGSITKGTERVHDKFLEKRLNFGLSQKKFLW